MCVCVCGCIGTFFSIRLKHNAVNSSTWDENCTALIQFTNTTPCWLTCVTHKTLCGRCRQHCIANPQNCQNRVSIPHILRSWRWGRSVFNFAASAVLTTVKGWGVGGLGKTKTAEYMMFQHVSNILPSFTRQKNRKGFPFETLLSATKVRSHFWDFKCTGYFHNILLPCYLEFSRDLSIHLGH